MDGGRKSHIRDNSIVLASYIKSTTYSANILYEEVSSIKIARIIASIVIIVISGLSVLTSATKGGPIDAGHLIAVIGALVIFSSLFKTE